MGIQRVAVIGAGISGLTSAWLLSTKYKVSLYERNDWHGGHAHTVDASDPGADQTQSIDTGFVVYNEKNYPNLIALFDYLGVPTQPTDMSFAVSLNQGELEYSGSGFNGLFAQRRNLISPSHWRLLLDIVAFNKDAKTFLEQPTQTPLTLGEFLTEHQHSRNLQQHYLLPMGAAIWSCPVETMLNFPAHSFLKFCDNHGLLDLKNRPKWRTVTGGSKQYVNKILKEIEGNVEFYQAANSVTRDAKQVVIESAEKQASYDAVVFACHADEALSLLEQPSQNEQEILGCFKYEENETWLHTDERLMPESKRVWSCWNYLANWSEQNTPVMSATYWANRLHRLQCDTNFFISLNPPVAPEADKVIARFNYSHPIFDQQAVAAQQQLNQVQGENMAWFCGSYAGYGFHEDGLTSAINTCGLLDVRPPWTNTEKLLDAA